jgi:hypothetical protein
MAATSIVEGISARLSGQREAENELSQQIVLSGEQ